MLTPRSVSLRGVRPPRSVSLNAVRIRAVLANFGFSEIFEFFSKYHDMDPKFLINLDFQKTKKFVLTQRSISLHGVQLRAVLACAEFDSAQF